MTESEKKEWVDWLNTKVLQKAVVVDEDGNFLSIRRTESGPGGRLGKWDLPGGSMEADDLVIGTKPHAETIKRELREETGLEGDEVEVIFADSGIKKTQTAGNVLLMTLGYKCKVKGEKPEVKLSNEHVEAKWGPKEEILNLDFGDDGGFHASIIKKA
ncbi:MAG: NUDIX hydrolase [Candidatus Daviesbacteria bacterium]|nr:NUDIX hydrolase [Candidatus Daviesbacteria bacterium]